MITIQVDTKDVERYLSDVQKKQLPFATSLAINKTAKDVQAALAKETSVFDRPKPKTQKPTYLKASDKKVFPISAEVGLKTRSHDAPVDEYLAAQVKGGSREDKRSEILLQRAGIMPPGYQTRPGSGAKMDDFGNMQSGQIVQILSYFKAFGGIEGSGRFGPKVKTASTKINRGARKPRIQYFVVPDGQPGLATGIWKRTGNKVEPILIFIKNATYRKRYDFVGVARKTIDSKFQRQFNDALTRALATAR